MSIKSIAVLTATITCLGIQGCGVNFSAAPVWPSKPSDEARLVRMEQAVQSVTAYLQQKEGQEKAAEAKKKAEAASE